MLLLPSRSVLLLLACLSCLRLQDYVHALSHAYSWMKFWQDLLIKHEMIVSQFLSSHYVQDTSKNIQISAFDIFKVFVANPNKPPEIIEVLMDNHEELLMSLQNLPMSKGKFLFTGFTYFCSDVGEDDQFEEEKDLIIKEIEELCNLPKAAAA
ncbi:hypothetical protein BHE74_00007131 [Ensete ventricosum]|nr:hypothetical protein GW17_00037545 [Ensete ventricosum]RWW84271.1 hypothetical protein BHE74_00007131 [Ensete ventricosum]